jgi:hypothetical protein
VLKSPAVKRLRITATATPVSAPDSTACRTAVSIRARACFLVHAASLTLTARHELPPASQ